jgi:hypothetical protein
MRKAQIFGSALAYAVLAYLGLNAAHAASVFIFERFDPKFGAMGAFKLGLLISLVAVPCSAIGYAMPLLAVSFMSKMKTTLRPSICAGVGGIYVVILFAVNAIDWLARILPFDPVTRVVGSNILIGILAGTATVITLWPHMRRTA